MVGDIVFYKYKFLVYSFISGLRLTKPVIKNCLLLKIVKSTRSTCNKEAHLRELLQTTV